MSENTKVVNNKDRYTERLKKRYPDRNFDDDEALFEQANNDYDNYDTELEGYRTNEKALSELFVSDPKSAAFVTRWSKGADPVAVLIELYGDDFRDALEDPQKLKSITEANKKFAEKVAKEKEYEEVHNKNIEETKKNIDIVKKQEGLDDEDIDKVMEFLIGVMTDGILGKFSIETITMGLKAINHDEDVAMADREGEVRGRNEKIIDKIKKTAPSDGITNLSGGGAPAPMERKRKSIFDLAKEAK
ncbi:MAG: hypothetical protein E7083_07655 [Bacteroidales bacterium]|nr:hypothetical protein [Bacteroidales bacterium]